MYEERNGESNIIITPDYPTHIVEDFRTYLTYISTHPIQLTKAKAYFTRKDLIAMYSQMKCDKREVAQHATQIGYPILHLFYQLSLVLGFMKIIRKQSSTVAMIQNQQIDSFMKLTATEQYLTLLDAFWTEADWDELQGEKWGDVPTNIKFLFRELESIPANKELELSKHERISEWVSDYGQFFSYFSYFGLWTFEMDQKKSNDPNRPISTIAKSIRLTPFFKKIQHALCEAWDPYKHAVHDPLFTLFESLFDLPNEGNMEESENTESLVALLSPVFSKKELTTILKKKQPSFKAGTYLFKVKLSSCWRKIQLSGFHTLLDLHQTIQDAFDFDDDHLYAFYMDGKKFSKHCYNAPMGSHGPYVNEIKIGELDLYEGQSFLYLFDFGDEWEFNIQVLKISDEGGAEIPKIVDKFGAAPEQYGW